jgi:hypothetical protein
MISPTLNNWQHFTTVGIGGQMAYPSPPQQPQYSAPPKKSGGGCWLWILGGCLVLIVGCVVLAGGGFLLYRSGLITVSSMLNLVGLGPADVEVDNFRDDAIQVSILQLDVPQSSNSNSSPAPAQWGYEMNAFDVHITQVQTHGRYRVDFGSTSGASDLGTCTLNLGSGDAYQFVTLPDKIVINHVNQPAKTGPDFIVATSALCR